MPNIVLQPFDQTIVESINVRKGDIVRKGQVLARLNPTFTAADRTAIKDQVDLLGAKATLAAARLKLGYTKITAPFDGVVGRRSAHDAQAVKKGDALFWITAQAPLRILFTVPESAMAAFPRGAKLELTTADYPHLKQPATVFRVSPVVDPASGSIEVIGSLDKASPLLKPGMSMQVKLSPR